jgi:hypothetical protein
MAEDKSAWLELRRRLDDVLGPEATMTLMENLPGERAATKGDLNALEQRVDLKLDALEHKLTGTIHELIYGVHERIDGVHERIDDVLEQIGAVRSDISTQTRLMVLALIGTVATVAALAFTATGLG